MSLKKKLLSVSVGALAAALSAVCSTAPVHASPPQVPSPGSTYVAMGSSYAAGGGLAPLDGDGFCGRSAVAYPNLIARALRLNLVNAACGGATTANLLTTPQTVQGPSGSTTVPAQIDAVTSDTALVTITIGGNDVSYISALNAESCLADLAADPTSEYSLILQQYGVCTPPDPAAVAAALGTLQNRIIDTVRAVQAKAPAARIVLVDYLTVLPANGKPCAVMPIGKQKQQEIQRLARDLSAATKQAAHATGVQFAAASSASSGHDVCSRSPWVTGYVPEPNMMHPNAAGHTAVAALVIRELLR